MTNFEYILLQLCQVPDNVKKPLVKKSGFEFKFTDAPKTSKSMHITLEDLALDHLFIIYPGTREIPFGEKLIAIGLESWVRDYFQRINEL